MALSRVPYTIYLPGELVPLAHLRKIEEHHSSDSEYGGSCILADIIQRPLHTLTRRIMNESPDIQHAIYKQIVADFPKREAERGAWMTKIIREIIEKNGI